MPNGHFKLSWDIRKGLENKSCLRISRRWDSCQKFCDKVEDIESSAVQHWSKSPKEPPAKVIANLGSVGNGLQLLISQFTYRQKRLGLHTAINNAMTAFRQACTRLEGVRLSATTRRRLLDEIHDKAQDLKAAILKPLEEHSFWKIF
jgi:hypothetical protein